DPAVRARMSAMFAEVAKLPHVTAVISPYARSSAGRAISANGKIAFATVVFDEKANLLPKSAPERVVQVARAAQRQGLQVDLGGQAIEATEQVGFGVSTGVGIDYALFILTRFREAYATPGSTFQNARESVVQAIDTAGRAVLFAGSTVVIALLGMMLLGVSFLYGVAISASIGVLLVMLASLTLLPALLTLSGARVAAGGRRGRRRAAKLAAGGAPSAPSNTNAAGAGWLRWS